MSIQHHGDSVQSGVEPSITPRRLRLSFSDSLKTDLHTPEFSVSPKSARSQIAPSRFQNLAQYWHQRAAGVDVVQLPSSSKSECASTCVTSSSQPSLSSQGDEDSDLQHCNVDRKIASPEDGYRFRPTPRRLCNLLESSPFSPGICDGARDRECSSSQRPSVHTTPSTNTTLRTPERPSPGTGLSSNTSIMSIGTPVKQGQSPRVAETEMELALDLVNHLPPKMMNRLIDVWQTNETDREHTHAGEKAECPEKLVPLPRRCAFTICQHLLWRLLWLLALLAVISFIFVAGFMTHMVWDTCTSMHAIDSERISVNVPFALDRLGSESFCAWVQSISIGLVQLHIFLGNHDLQQSLLGSPEQLSFQAIGANPFPYSDHSRAVPGPSTYSMEGRISNSSHILHKRRDAVASVDYSQIEASFESQSPASLESAGNLKATTLSAGNSPGPDLRVGYDIGMKADGAGDIDRRRPSHETRFDTPLLDGGIEGALRMESQIDNGDWQFNAELFVFEYRGDVRQSCLDAAASWRASGASVSVPEGDLYAENACNAAASPKDVAGSTRRH